MIPMIHTKNVNKQTNKQTNKNNNNNNFVWELDCDIINKQPVRRVNKAMFSSKLMVPKEKGRWTPLVMFFL